MKKGPANNLAFIFLMATYKPTTAYNGPAHNYSVEDPDLSFYNHELHRHLLANSWAFCKNSLIFLENYSPVVVAKVRRVKVPRIVINWSGLHLQEMSHVYSIHQTEGFEKLSNPSKKSVNTLFSKIREQGSDFILTTNPHQPRAATITRPDLQTTINSWRAGNTPIRLSGPYEMGVVTTLDLMKWLLPQEIPENINEARDFLGQLRMNRNTLERMASVDREVNRAELTRLLENLPNE